MSSAVSWQQVLNEILLFNPKVVRWQTSKLLHRYERSTELDSSRG